MLVSTQWQYLDIYRISKEGLVVQRIRIEAVGLSVESEEQKTCRSRKAFIKGSASD